ncbi:MAG: hypothetical protein JO356_06805 [Acidobacteria bacterium]|nr:hypothetical protein [Acidobacteriota bacterium]
MGETEGRLAVDFEQAAIKVQQEKEFQQLKAGIESALSPANVEKFLRSLRGRGIRVRDFDSALDQGLLERGERAERRGEGAKSLYQKLAVSDQAQIKEFYLFKVEEVGPELRAKFHKLYQYY